jgi:hypothetical protein
MQKDYAEISGAKGSLGILLKESVRLLSNDHFEDTFYKV